MNPPFIPQNVIFLRWIIAIKVIQEHGHEFGLKSAGDKDVFGSFLSEVLGIGHMTHYVQLHVSNVDNVYGSIYVAKFKNSNGNAIYLLSFVVLISREIVCQRR